MPLYAYECSNGHLTEEIRKIEAREDPIVCWNCNERAKLIIAGSTPQVFKTEVWDDIDIHPVEIRSKKQLERECRKRGIFARNYMENYSPAERLIRYGA